MEMEKFKYGLFCTRRGIMSHFDSACSLTSNLSRSSMVPRSGKPRFYQQNQDNVETMPTSPNNFCDWSQNSSGDFMFVDACKSRNCYTTKESEPTFGKKCTGSMNNIRNLFLNGGTGDEIDFESSTSDALGKRKKRTGKRGNSVDLTLKYCIKLDTGAMVVIQVKVADGSFFRGRTPVLTEFPDNTTTARGRLTTITRLLLSRLPQHNVKNV